MKRSIVLTVVAVAAALSLAGCGGGDGADTGAGDAPIDQAFIDAMVPHHEQAIEMARAAKAAGLSDPVLVDIADAIVATQQDEIDRMKAWRLAWFGSSEIDPDGASALGMSMEEMGMTEIELDFTSATDVDGAFATMMIAHHQGAIAMAALALQQSERPEIQALAQDIVDAQELEVEAMMPLADENAMAGMGHS